MMIEDVPYSHRVVFSVATATCLFVEPSTAQFAGSLCRRAVVKRHHTLKTPIHAFITSRLDYCNSLLLGLLTMQQLKRLHSVQNAAALW